LFFFFFDLLHLTLKHNRIDVLQWTWTIEWKKEQTQQFIIVDTSIVYMDGKAIKTGREKGKNNVSKLCIFKTRWYIILRSSIKILLTKATF
jgi:hypothetical protein